jgi:FtsP/CotA-like multicopper oxidase with cupredoxin domain
LFATLPLLIAGLAAVASSKPAGKGVAHAGAGGKVNAAEVEKVRPVKIFHLYVQDGDWELADGTKTYVISYVKWNENFDEMPAGGTLPPVQIPAPTMRVKVGDEVHVFLHNTGHQHAGKDSAIKNVPHTIHFHGLDLVQAMDGVPDVPAEGLPPKIFSGVVPGDSFEYKFVAEHEGTYSYHCHVDSSTHILLGMYGAFIIDGEKPNTIYGHHFDREYTMLLSELDTAHNEAIKTEGSYDMMKWKSDYFLLNGRIFVSDLTNPLSTIADPKSAIVANEGETVLLRFIAMGSDHTFAYHPHAYHMQVIGTDGRGLDSPYWKDTLPLVSGERYDVLIPIINKRNKVCMSCGMGKGISIAHDHNLRGEASGGQYPKGPLTVFIIK